DRPGEHALLGPFVDGLVQGAHVSALASLAAEMLAGDDGGTALDLAARLPLDPIAGALVGQLEHPSPVRRVQACAAVVLLDHAAVDPTLAARLADASPDVAAAATRALRERGRTDLLASAPRRASVTVGRGELAVPALGELVQHALIAHAEQQPSPCAALAAEVLLGSPAGLELAADLIANAPEALYVLAAPRAEQDAGVLAPPGPRAGFARAALGLAAAGPGDELGALALYTLARLSAGDATLAEVVADALAASDGQAALLVAALGELRVASEPVAAALAPLLDPAQPIGARVLAAAVCGRALPRDHAAWAQVRELGSLGSLAGAAAWSALRDRARRHSSSS
ncbi:MAG TPA: hypothetical protein VLX92_32610, partial [Kofleriaceae bacterium]|nr:hypothetical protein [Kofleriaceae bacterium]